MEICKGTYFLTLCIFLVAVTEKVLKQVLYKLSSDYKEEDKTPTEHNI